MSVSGKQISQINHLNVSQVDKRRKFGIDAAHVEGPQPGIAIPNSTKP